MIDPHDFARKQLELTGEFGKYLLDHPEVDGCLPEGAYVYFNIVGETAFNQYSQELAKRRQDAGVPVICVRVKGLAPPQGSRLIEPVVEPAPAGSRSTG